MMNNSAMAVDVKAYSKKADKINKTVARLSQKISDGSVTNRGSYKKFAKNSKVKSYGL